MGLTFAPKDVNPIDFQGKDDVHGLGYSGINPRTAFSGGSGGHFTLFDEPDRARPSGNRKGRKGMQGHVRTIALKSQK